MLCGHPASGSMTLYDGYTKAKNNERKKRKRKKGKKLKRKLGKKVQNNKEKEKKRKKGVSTVLNLRPPAYNADVLVRKK
jgi:hypothetical protein